MLFTILNWGNHQTYHSNKNQFTHHTQTHTHTTDMNIGRWCWKVNQSNKGDNDETLMIRHCILVNVSDSLFSQHWQNNQKYVLLYACCRFSAKHAIMTWTKSQTLTKYEKQVNICNNKIHIIFNELQFSPARKQSKQITKQEATQIDQANTPHNARMTFLQTRQI